ncbi:MAG: hypothetical protein LBK55_03645 [Azoarcus sp.]|jgi:Fic family protein|nr:hypothetical protein [Azoarcus sp.]
MHVLSHAHKADYYRLLQAVRDADAWEDWVLYVLTAVEQTARESITVIQAIKKLLQETKHRIRKQYRFYSQDLINNPTENAASTPVSRQRPT